MHFYILKCDVFEGILSIVRWYFPSKSIHFSLTVHGHWTYANVRQRKQQSLHSLKAKWVIFWLNQWYSVHSYSNSTRIIDLLAKIMNTLHFSQLDFNTFHFLLKTLRCKWYFCLKDRSLRSHEMFMMSDKCSFDIAALQLKIESKKLRCDNSKCHIRCQIYFPYGESSWQKFTIIQHHVDLLQEFTAFAQQVDVTFLRIKCGREWKKSKHSVNYTLTYQGFLDRSAQWFPRIFKAYELKRWCVRLLNLNHLTKKENGKQSTKEWKKKTHAKEGNIETKKNCTENCAKECSYNIHFIRAAVIYLHCLL